MANKSGKYYNCCAADCHQLNHNNGYDTYYSEAPSITDEFDFFSDYSCETSGSKTPTSNQNIICLNCAQQSAKIPIKSSKQIVENCPIHSQKNIDQLEESFWARWKPGRDQKQPSRPNCGKPTQNKKLPCAKPNKKNNTLCSQQRDCSCARCHGDINSKVNTDNYYQCSKCHKYIKIGDKGGDCVRCLHKNLNMYSTDSSDYISENIRRNNSTIEEEEENEQAFIEYQEFDDSSAKNQSKNLVVQPKNSSVKPDKTQTVNAKDVHLIENPPNSQTLSIQSNANTYYKASNMIDSSKTSPENNEPIQVIFDRKADNKHKDDYTSEDMEDTQGTEETTVFQAPNIKNYPLKNEITSRHFVTAQKDGTRKSIENEKYIGRDIISQDSSYWHEPVEHKPAQIIKTDKKKSYQYYHNNTPARSRASSVHSNPPNKMNDQGFSSENHYTESVPSKKVIPLNDVNSSKPYTYYRNNQNYVDKNVNEKLDTKSIPSGKSDQSKPADNARNLNTIKPQAQTTENDNNYSRAQEYQNQGGYVAQNVDSNKNNYEYTPQPQHYYPQPQFVEPEYYQHVPGINEYDNYYPNPNQYNYDDNYNYQYGIEAQNYTPPNNQPVVTQKESFENFVPNTRNIKIQSLDENNKNRERYVESPKMEPDNYSSKTYGSGNLTGTSKFGNRSTLRPHSYPLKPILKRDRRVHIQTVRTPSPNAPFKFNTKK